MTTPPEERTRRLATLRTLSPATRAETLRDLIINRAEITECMHNNPVIVEIADRWSRDVLYRAVLRLSERTVDDEIGLIWDSLEPRSNR